jgi:hypothetical protein
MDTPKKYGRYHYRWVIQQRYEERDQYRRLTGRLTEWIDSAQIHDRREAETRARYLHLWNLLSREVRIFDAETRQYFTVL